MKKNYFFLLFYMVAFFCSCSEWPNKNYGGDPLVRVGVSVGDLVSVGITSPNSTVIVGTHTQLNATGTYADGTTVDVSSTVIWASSTDVVSIATSGLLTARKVGSTVVTATIGGLTSKPLPITTEARVPVLKSLVIANLQATLTPTGQSVVSLPVGVSTSFTATAIYDDNSTQNVTNSVVWSSSVANVQIAYGVAQGLSTGSTAIQASLQSLDSKTIIDSNTIVFTVASIPLVSLTISTLNPSFVAGSSLQVSALGTYADGTVADVTAAVFWNNAPYNVVDVEKGTVTTVAPWINFIGSSAQQTTLRAKLGTVVSNSLSLTIQPPILQQPIVIQPAAINFTPHDSQVLTAIGTYSNHLSQNISDQVFWSSSLPSIASITPASEGESPTVVGVAVGTASITASLNDITTAVTVSVNAKSVKTLVIIPGQASMPAGFTQQFKAIAVFDDGSQADYTHSPDLVWTVSHTQISKISNITPNKGLFSSLSPGSVTVSAQYGETSTQASVNITDALLQTIVIVPSSTALAQGTTQVFTATGTYSDGTSADVSKVVSWVSANKAIVVMGANGQVNVATGHAQGSSTVSAFYQGIPSNSVTATVTPATLQSIALTPSSLPAAMPLGSTQQFTVQGTYSDGSVHPLDVDLLGWSSSNKQVAIVENGLVKAAGFDPQSTATITATSLSDNKEASIPITVTNASLVSVVISPSQASVPAGLTQQFSAWGIYSDGTTQDISASASWNSSNLLVSNISSTGLFKSTTSWDGQKDMTSYVSAGVGDQSPAVVTITPAVLQSISITTVDVSSNIIGAGSSQQLQAVGTFSDGSTQDITTMKDIITNKPLITWSSSNPAVTISASGLVTGVSTGSAVIQANAVGGLATVVQSPPLPLSVVNTPATLASIRIALASDDSATGLTSTSVSPLALLSLSAIGTYQDGTTQNITGSVVWTSDATAVATVINGVVTAHAPGVAHIQASLGSASTGAQSLALTVNRASLQTLVILAPNTKFITGTTSSLTAIGTFSDGTTSNLSSFVSWSSDNTSAATVDANGVLLGTLNGSAAATTNIMATYQSRTSNSLAIQIIPAVLNTIQIFPAKAILTAGATQQFTAFGTYSNNTTRDLTASVTWTGSNANASVSTGGLAQGLANGVTTVTGTLGGSSGSAVVSVSSATLSSIVVSPGTTTVAVGAKQAFTATGVYSDGSQADISGAVTWSSSDGNVASFGTGVFNTTLLQGLKTGTASITASLGSLSSSAVVTVDTLQSISIAATSTSLAPLSTQQFTATGNFSSGHAIDLTNQVMWISSSPAYASMTSGANAVGGGLAIGVAPGTTNITASISGVSSNSIALTVTDVVLQGISIVPSSLSLAVGTSQQLSVVGLYSDGISRPIEASNSVVWSFDLDYITITKDGMATAKQVTSSPLPVTATAAGLQTAVNATVSAATLTSLFITPSSASFPAGKTQQFGVLGIFSDGTIQDMTTQATWSSLNNNVATIIANGVNAGLATGVTVGTASLTASFQGLSAIQPSLALVQPPLVTGIVLSPASSAIPLGATQQLTITASYSDNSSGPLPNSYPVVWTSSADSVASISTSGLVTGLVQNASPVTLMADVQGVGVVTAQTVVTGKALRSVAIKNSGGVQQSTYSLVSGTTQQYRLIGTYTDSSTVDLTSSATWTISGTTGVVTIGTALGSFKGIASGNTCNNRSASAINGTTTITASAMGQSATVTINVTAAQLIGVTLSPTSASIQSTTTKQFTLSGVYSDTSFHPSSTCNLTTLATWTSSNKTNATIDNTGLAKGELSNVSGNATATITASYNGISKNAGLTITLAPLTTLTIQPVSPLAVGLTAQLVVAGTYKDGVVNSNLTNPQPSWQASPSSVATVSTSGLLTSFTQGTVSVMAQIGSVQSDPISVTIGPPKLNSMVISPSSASIQAGSSQSFTVTELYSDGQIQPFSAGAPNVVWSSPQATSSPALVGLTPNGASVAVAGLSMGTATLVATDTAAGIVGQTTVTITAPPPLYRYCGTMPLQDSSGYNNQYGGSFMQVAITPDFAQLIVLKDGALIASCPTTNLQFGSNSIGNYYDFTACGSYIGGYGTNASLFQVSGGSLNYLQAMLRQNWNASCPSAAPTSVQITPSDNQVLIVGQPFSFKATAYYSDGFTPPTDVTSVVGWVVSPASAASVSGSGAVTALSQGTGNQTYSIKADAYGVWSNSVTFDPIASQSYCSSYQGSTAKATVSLQSPLTVTYTVTDPSQHVSTYTCGPMAKNTNQATGLEYAFSLPAGGTCPQDVLFGTGTDGGGTFVLKPFTSSVPILDGTQNSASWNPCP